VIFEANRPKFQFHVSTARLPQANSAWPCIYSVLPY